MLETLKRELQDLVANAEFDRVFQRLNEIVTRDVSNSLRKDLVLVQSRYSEAVRAGNLNLIDFKELNMNFSHVGQAALWLIDRISIDDLGDNYRKNVEEQRAIPPVHALTCDRNGQKSAFDENYFFEPGPAQKFRFFYLYGDARQELESLFKRFAYDRNGLINARWRQGAEATSREPVFRLCKPEFSESARLFEMYVLRDLFACFFDPLNDQQINPASKLSDLLASPDIKQLGPDDHVFILFTIDDYNWREDVTPMVVKRLFEGFYKCDLPPEAPKFNFFFGMEYSQTNQPVKEQVARAIQGAEHGTPLQELQAVELRFIGEWFSRYKELCTDDREPLQMAEWLFQGKTTVDMADIEPVLTELLEKHNKGLI